MGKGSDHEVEATTHTTGKHEYNHAAMVEEFKRKFIVSLILTVPIIVLSPGIQEFFGYGIVFQGSSILLWVLSMIVYTYGGSPFLRGVVKEIRTGMPGMTTLISVAISTAYFYSTGYYS